MDVRPCAVCSPAGLAAGLRIKQLGEEQGVDYSVCILEKAAELGAHILSGNVFEPRALDELLPGWREDEGCPINTPVNSDEFLVLSETGSVPIPNFLLPPVSADRVLSVPVDVHRARVLPSAPLRSRVPRPSRVKPCTPARI